MLKQRDGWGSKAPLSIALGAGIFGWAVFQSVRSADAAVRQNLSEGMQWVSPLSIKLILLLLCVVAPQTCLRCWRVLFPRRDDLLQLCAIVLITAVACGLSVRFQHRVYYDEDVYIQIARGIASDGRARTASAVLLSADRYECLAGVYPKWPNGWAAVLSLLFRVVGPQESAAFLATFAVSLLHIVWIAALSKELFPAGHVWLFAAAIYAALPANAAWRNTTAVDSAAAALNTATLLAFCILSRYPHSWSALLLAVATAVLAVQFRAESLLILPVALLVLLLRSNRDRITLASSATLWRFCLGLAILLILLLPHWVHMGLIGVEYDTAMGEGVGFNLKHVGPNLASNASYFVSEPFMVATTVLAMLGIVSRRRQRLAWVLLLWFLLFWGVFLFYFVGSYRFPGLERYVVVCLAPYAILAGSGLDVAVRWLARVGRVVPVFPAAALLLLAGILSTPSHLERWDQPTRALLEEHEFLRAAMAEVPADAIVFSPIPSVIINMDRSSIWPYPSLDADVVEGLATNFADKLYLYSGLVPWGENAEGRLIAEWREQCAPQPIVTHPVGPYQLIVSKLCGLRPSG